MGPERRCHTVSMRDMAPHLELNTEAKSAASKEEEGAEDAEGAEGAQGAKSEVGKVGEVGVVGEMGGVGEDMTSPIRLVRTPSDPKFDRKRTCCCFRWHRGERNDGRAPRGSGGSEALCDRGPFAC